MNALFNRMMVLGLLMASTILLSTGDATAYVIASSENIQCPDEQGAITLCASFQSSDGINPASIQLLLIDPDGNSSAPITSGDLALTAVFNGYVACYTFTPGTDGFWIGNWDAYTGLGDPLGTDQDFLLKGDNILNIEIREDAGAVTLNPDQIEIKYLCGDLMDIGPKAGDLPCNTCPTPSCASFNTGSLFLIGPVELMDGKLKIERTSLCANVILDNVDLDGTLEIKNSNLQEKVEIKNTDISKDSKVKVERLFTAEPLQIRNTQITGKSEVNYKNSCIQDPLVIEASSIHDSKVNIEKVFINSYLELEQLNALNNGTFEIKNSCILAQSDFLDVILFKDASYIIDGLTITDYLQLTGNFLNDGKVEIKNNTFKSIDIRGLTIRTGGELKIEDNDVNTFFTIEGMLIAENSRFELKNSDWEASSYFENTKLESGSKLQIDNVTVPFGSGFGKGITADGFDLDDGEYKIKDVVANEGIKMASVDILGQKLEFNNLTNDCFVQFVTANIENNDVVFNSDISSPCPGIYTGTFKTKLPDAAIGTDETNRTSVKAWPNPFQAQATIEVYYAKEERVSLKVFNLDGQEIANLFEGIVIEGSTERYSLDASDLPSGMYIYTLQSESGEIRHGKLILMK